MSDNLLKALKRWGNYDIPPQLDDVVQEEIQVGVIRLRSIDRRTHIEVFEVRKGKRVAGKFIPGNVLIDNYKRSDKLWQAKALITALKGSSEGVAILTTLVKALYNDASGKVFLNNMVETLKSQNRLEELSRIITARMMMNS